MKVTVSRRLLDKFRREAKAMFPLEAFSVMLGRCTVDGVVVSSLFIPSDQRKSGDINSVPMANVWLAAARRVADDCKMFVVGELHSHAESGKWKHDTSPSADDWDRASAAGWYVHGVCSIRKHENGRISTRIRFWPARLDIKEKILE
jgi:hypothetical protein